jgi:hypothetical protein
MDGTVLGGPNEGRDLTDLNLGELLDLLRLCRAQDSQSTNLLEAFLDRTQDPEWRAMMGDEDDDAGGGQGGGPRAEAPMTHDEAYRILGLEAGADANAIKGAHRTLMQKIHPDHGGSSYLAAKINEAKDLLLGG